MVSLIPVLVEIVDQQINTLCLTGRLARISQYNIIEGFQLTSVPGKNQDQLIFPPTKFFKIPEFGIILHGFQPCLIKYKFL